jgi:hypothetical protein
VTNLDRIPVDPVALHFKGADHKALAEALEKAYPNPNLLDQMLTARLDQPLNGITAPFPVSQATFDIVTFYRAKGHLLRLIAAARASQPDNPQLALVAERFHLATPTPATAELEKIVKATSVPFAVAVWRERLARREVCVCRIEVPTNDGMAFGSGFLVGADLVLTNEHVMSPAIAGREGRRDTNGRIAAPKEVVVRFDYKELGDKRVVNPGVEVALADDWLVDSSPPSPADLQGLPKTTVPSIDELDHALIRLRESIGAAPIALGHDIDPQAKARGWIELPEADWPFAAHTSLFILQHPKGAPMALALDLEARMEVNANRTRVIYQTGTEPGSSGSPCFNQYWEVVALHHAGDPLYPDLHPGAFNEGIPIAQIIRRLKQRDLTGGLRIV